MKILIGADMVPTERNKELFVAGDAHALVGDDLYNILSDADVRIFNLEVPLADKTTPIEKRGPSLIAPIDTIYGYKALKTDILTLANNHILDQGMLGLQSTIDTLQAHKIAYLGAGSTPEQASRPYVFSCDGKKIGLYACAEHEYSIVTETSPGANPIDLLESLDHIYELKRQCDFVIVLYHGGKEYYRYPSPQLQKICRKMIEKGADLVLCQHTHCVGCEEKYQEGTIVYGQGNFLFDNHSDEYWNTGLLVEVGDDFNISYYPIQKNNGIIKLAIGKEAKQILDGFKERSIEIQSEGFVTKRYQEFAASMLNQYLLRVGGKQNLVFRTLNKLTKNGLIKNKYGRSQILSMQNSLECEAHRELFVCGLKEVLRK